MSAIRRTTAWTLAGLTVAAATVVLGAGSSAADPAARDDDGVSAVRQATEQFHDVDVAIAHGYRPAGGCLPGMGFHYVHPELAGDGQLVPTRPEVLLYAPAPDDELVLVGVEYFIAEQAVRGQHPRVLGRPLEGPMDGHGGPMPRHYDLHLWAWRDNPNGVATAWNPDVSC